MEGWFGVHKWKSSTDELNEINLNALVQRTSHTMLDTLLHEMAHLKNWQHGVDDVVIETQYHNDLYKKAAESFGLKVRKGRKRGYAFTTLGPEAIKAIRELEPDESVFDLYRKSEI